ncbi:MAG: dihydroorotate dehydrogenase electron transfer subunit [Calditrichaeota bacterium]|nr:MAG: dihydroorotate dehydrogenase electron transfer subunit [Calditrichota bacterium]
MQNKSIFSLTCPVLKVEQVLEHTYILTVEADTEKLFFKSAQFAMILVNLKSFPLLPRPFSIYDQREGELDFIFDTVGLGTNELANKQKGDLVKITGPLGNSFCLEDNFETGIIVAGGIGIAPFKMLYEELLTKGKKVQFYYGARNKNLIHKIPSAEKLYRISTDDGSEGFHGYISQLLEKDLLETMPKNARVFACGPNVMLNATAQVAEKFGIPCEISLESVMACGLGVCQACVIDETNSDKYKLICHHGPIFDSKEVVLH